MTYSAKSSAVRAAKKAHGEGWQEVATIQPAPTGGWEIVKNEPIAKPEKTKGDATANKLAMGWVLSTTEKPTKKVWAIADSMPGASRKEVIAACVAAGIAPGTARTQYQAWFSAMKSSGLNPRG